MRHLPQIRALLPLGLTLLLVACASGPRPPVSGDDLGERIAAAAVAQVGAPYRFGGGDPAGFDCSGLVRYAHALQGVGVPRTTDEQYRSAAPVQLAALQAGDLLFFRFDGTQVSHVAIYAGNGRFVHAPQTGRPVETRALNEPAYRSRLVGAGRLH